MNPLSAEAVAATLAAIRVRAPLVHNVTNIVVANSTANALLAIGASPAMVEGADEVAEFAAGAAAVVINLGTMSPPRADACRFTARAAMQAGRPWVLDPVAVAGLPTRLALARDLLAFRPAAIRGNASEVMALAGVAASGAGGVTAGGARGVDSAASAEEARHGATVLARASGAVVATTGAVDYVTDGARVAACRNGRAIMTRVTGLGCTATALAGACLAVEADALVAVAHALAVIGVAGEIAAARSRGPGSLQMELLDALYLLDEPVLAARLRLDWTT